MSEEDKRWRCPYCDGLNDWQSETCEICGDGRRDEAEAAEKNTSTAEMPKTYTPPERRAEPEAPRPEPVKEGKPAYAPPSPPASEPPKKKKKGGVWVAIVIVILAALGGRFLGDSFVRSVEANKPTPTPLAVIETVAPKATRQADEAPATETPAAQTSLYETLRAQQSANPLVSIASVTDDGNGLATLHMKFAGQPQPYTVYCCYLGTDPDAASPLRYRLEESDDRFMPALRFRSIEMVSRVYEKPATLPVIPGGYTCFIVSGYTEDNKLSWSVSEPVFFEDGKGDFPLAITDVRLCGYNENNDRYDHLKALEGHDDAGVPRPEAFALTTAKALNQCAAMPYYGMNDGSGKFLAYDVAMRLDVDPYNFRTMFRKDAFGGMDHKLLALLTGPGFCVADAAHAMSIDKGDCRIGTWDSVFDNNFLVVNDMGGYPPGDYTLDFFVYGRRLYTMRFTLD